MKIEINEETKKEILHLISIPGIEIENIAEKVKVNYEMIIQFLSEEYLKHNFDYGRRLCCRF
jgi:hypothetical protein